MAYIMMTFPFTKYSKIYYLFSGILIAASIASLVMFGLKFGIECTGGTNMEVEFVTQRPNNEKISQQLAEFNLGETTIQPTGDKGAICALRELTKPPTKKFSQK